MGRNEEIYEPIPVNYSKDPALFGGVVNNYVDILVGVGMAFAFFIIAKILFIDNAKSGSVKFFWTALTVVPLILGSVSIDGLSVLDRIKLKQASKQNKDKDVLSYQNIKEKYTFKDDYDDYDDYNYDQEPYYEEEHSRRR